MYSNNDFRSYQELYHAEEKKKAKWPWLPGGKNTPEYNHWYYMTHPEKWGITKAGQQALDAAGNAVNKFVQGTETDLDDKALAGLKSGYNTAKNAVTSTNAYKNAKNVASDVRRSTEAMQRRDDADRTANKAASAAESYREKAKTSTGADKQRYTRLAKQAEETEKRNRSQAGQESVNAKGYATRARNTAKSAVTNTVDMYKNRIGNAIDDTKLNINRRITNNNTQVDNYLRNAVKEASEGNFKAAGNGLKNAGRQAVREAGDAIRRGARDAGDAIGDATNKLERRVREGVRNSNTQVDDHLVRAFDRLTDKDQKDIAKRLKGAGREAVGAGREAVSDVKKALGNAVDNVGNTVNKLKNAAEGYDAYKDLERTNRKFDSVTDNPSKISDAERRLADARSKEGGATGARLAETTSNTKKNSIEAAKTASKSVREIYDHAMKELGDIRDKYGQNSPQYLQALKDAKDDALDAIDKTGSQLRIKFYTSAGTVASEMGSGAEWIANAFDGLISREEIAMMEFTPDESQAQQRRNKQQTEASTGKYTAYMNEEADRRRRESQRR